MKTILNMNFIQFDNVIIFKIDEQDDMLRSESNETKLIARDYVTIGGKEVSIVINSNNYPEANFGIDKNLIPTLEIYLRGKARDLDNRSAVIGFPSEELASIFYINIEKIFERLADLHSFTTYAKSNDYRWYKTMHITIEDRLDR